MEKCCCGSVRLYWLIDKLFLSLICRSATIKQTIEIIRFFSGII